MINNFKFFEGFDNVVYLNIISTIVNCSVREINVSLIPPIQKDFEMSYYYDKAKFIDVMLQEIKNGENSI